MIGTSTQESQQLLAQVLIIGSDPPIRRALRELMAHEKDLAVCGEADDLHQAMEALEGVTPDVVVLDLTHKDGDSADLIRRIRKHWSNAKAVIVSANAEAFPCLDMIEIGVLGVVSKHEATERIVEAIRSALRGCMFCAPKRGSGRVELVWMNRSLLSR